MNTATYFNTVTDIRDTAALFGWRRHTENSRDTYTHGPHAIFVDYTKAGAIHEAQRFYFYKINDMELHGVAEGRNKRATVVSWLVGYGS